MTYLFFSGLPSLHKPHELIAYFTYYRQWHHILYQRWVILAIVISIVAADPEGGGPAASPSAIQYPLQFRVAFREPLVPFRLARIMCDFLCVAGVWLLLLSGDGMTIVLLFGFPFFSSCSACFCPAQTRTSAGVCQRMFTPKKTWSICLNSYRFFFYLIL